MEFSKRAEILLLAGENVALKLDRLLRHSADWNWPWALEIGSYVNQKLCRASVVFDQLVHSTVF